MPDKSLKVRAEKNSAKVSKKATDSCIVDIREDTSRTHLDILPGRNPPRRRSAKVDVVEGSPEASFYVCVAH